jgi:hypothetical protein
MMHVTTFSTNADLWWAALAVSAFLALVYKGISWLIGGPLIP